MVENHVRHTPTSWIGPRINGHDFIEILFSTLQESWGIRFYLYWAQAYGCDLYPAVAELARSHITALSNLVTDTSPEGAEDSCFDTDDELHQLDQILQRELALRSRMLSELNTQVVESYPSMDEWDDFARGLEYIANAHAALVQRLRFLRQRMDDLNLQPETIESTIMDKVITS